MKSKLILLVLAILILGVVPAFAQEDSTHTVSFDGFTFSFDATIGTNVNITQYAGDDPSEMMPGGPEPRHTQFVIYNGDVAPEAFGAPAFIRVYDMADFAGYTDREDQLAQLQGLIDGQVDLTPYMSNNDTDYTPLPFIPNYPAGQTFRARAAYVQTEQVTGIVYLTLFRHDAAPATAGEFMYTFQGYTNDGAHYISAVIRPMPLAFPVAPETFDFETFDAGAYYADVVTQMNAALSEDFALPLTLLDSTIASFSFN